MATTKLNYFEHTFNVFVAMGSPVAKRLKPVRDNAFGMTILEQLNIIYNCNKNFVHIPETEEQKIKHINSSERHIANVK